MTIYDRAREWRDATRELVLVGATVIAAANQSQSQGSVSITLTGKAFSTGLLLADAGTIALASLSDHEDVRRHPMRVVQMRLDVLSDLPSIAILGRDMTESTQLRLVVELTARNPHTDTTSIIACECESVRLDAQTPLALLDFQPRRTEPLR